MENFTSNVLSIAQGGMGVLKPSGQVVFVPNVMVGEEVRVQITAQKKSYALGMLTEILTQSPHRVQPDCQHYEACGGCDFQHMSYDAQLLAKKTMVSDALERIAKVSLPVSIEGANNIWGYRRHVRLKLWPHKTGFRLGFVGKDKTHVPIKQCDIFLKTDVLTKLDALVATFPCEKIKEARVSILKDAETFVLFFEFEPKIPKKIVALLNSALDHGTFFKGVILKSPHEQIEIGEVEVKIAVLGKSFTCRPDAFVQNNAEQSEKIYQDLLEQIKNLKTSCEILDLYSGIGISSILLAHHGFKVTSVELSPQAVALAEKNALENQVQTAQKLLPAEKALADFNQKNVVILNPPRTGAKPEVIQALINAKPAHIFYISCMPPTLARDIKALVESGYKAVFIKAYDMFPHTTHVECLVHLMR